MSKDPKLPTARFSTLEQAQAELERELNVRNRCFPGWISDGRVNRVDAVDRRDRLHTAMHVLDIVATDATLLAFVESALSDRAKASLSQPAVPA
jgi:hypothetical protein